MTEFTEQLASLSDREQMTELRMVASERTINTIKAAAAADEQYGRLKCQIAAGWPPRMNDVPPDLRKFYTYADELAVCDDLVFEGSRLLITARST